MYRRTVLKLPLLLPAAAAVNQIPRGSAEPPLSAGGSSRWSPDRVNRWYQAQGWLVGANYITSSAVNQLEMFQAATFDPRRIDTELGWARSAGINSVRVFLHDLLWVQDARGFLGRLTQFVEIAAKHSIKPLFVFFDSCWDPYPKLGPQRAPRPGVHNSGWVQSPGAEHLGDRRYTRIMRDYVRGVLTQFRYDDRILGWDVWNEPDNPSSAYSETERDDKADLVAELLPQAFQWARSIGVCQPLTSGVWHWEGDAPASHSQISAVQLDNSDVITFHCYDMPAAFESRIDELAPLGRPIICTEYLARTRGSTVDGILPVAKRRHVGAFNWGLVAGKTQTYIPWNSWEQPYAMPPKVWFHDLLDPNGQPYRDDEIRAMRGLTGSP